MKKVFLSGLAVMAFVCIANFSFAQTVIMFEATNALNDTIVGFNFDVEPASEFSSFIPGDIIPSSWTGIFSNSPTITWFDFQNDAGSEDPLISGMLGRFDSDVILSNFGLGVSGGIGAPEIDREFWVNLDEISNTYTITGTPVPIPPALLLFGSGLIGLVGLRRKIKK